MAGVLEFSASAVMDAVASVPSDAPVRLVGDQGVYLFIEGNGARFIVYAKGCHPEKDVLFYEKKRRIYGGDDGVDEIGTAGQLLRIAARCKGSLGVKVSRDAFSILVPA